MAEENKYLAMSDAELERQENLMRQAREAKGAGLDVAAAVALKWSLSHLKERNKLGSGWDAISPQMLPKEAVLAKPAGFSETQITNIRKATEEALKSAGKKFGG